MSYYESLYISCSCWIGRIIKSWRSDSFITWTAREWNVVVIKVDIFLFHTMATITGILLSLSDEWFLHYDFLRNDNFMMRGIIIIIWQRCKLLTKDFCDRSMTWKNCSHIKFAPYKILSNQYFDLFEYK